jgi:plasmid maintenance system antidote protein VapI
MRMFDVEQIKEFMRRHELTQAELANKLHCGRSTLVRVLNGQREVSASLAARMQELMDEQRDYIAAEVPEDVAEQLQAWAEEAHSTIDAIVQKLLATLPRLKK